MFTPGLIQGLNASDKSLARLQASTVQIEAGNFTPLYGLPKGKDSVFVPAFRIDRYPVTNSEFYQFYISHPAWQKDRVLPILADQNYLKHWVKEAHSSKIRFRAKDSKKPVTNISWFAANDYCVSKGARLPKLYEWEYVAAADETKANAQRDPQFVERLLAWYSRPFVAGEMQEIGKSAPNFWGVYDLHQLVWEWSEDFNSVFVTGDNRQDGDKLKNLFCGAGSTNAADKSDYAAFMRYALRNSVQANYALENMGFRCAYDLVGVSNKMEIKK